MSRNDGVVIGSRSDVDLLRGIAAGDDAAFAVFYRAHVDGIVAFFRRRVESPELAFDLTAETFAAVVVSAESFNGDAPAIAWLFGIARNKLRESVRSARVEDMARRRLGLEPIVLADTDIERIDSATDGEALARMLAALPDPTRQAIMARHVEELDYAEIATRLACSEQVVRQRVHRGLTQLRARLKEEQ
jgi:RNA polymerase sigma factor (sigma-70 family)